jgi:hypothetical protein
MIPFSIGLTLSCHWVPEGMLTPRSKETHSVREFIERSFAVIGTRIRWEGEGLDEVGMCEETGRVVVRVDPQYFRYVGRFSRTALCGADGIMLTWRKPR